MALRPEKLRLTNKSQADMNRFGQNNRLETKVSSAYHNTMTDFNQNKKVLKLDGQRQPEHQRVKTELLSNESPEITKISAESINPLRQPAGGGGQDAKMLTRLSGEKRQSRWSGRVRPWVEAGLYVRQCQEYV